mmetsp:Transcript_44889/g.80854  ORF Transcript_44889/g.80854 Transcript_44889/m.80854 type:complete len:368 (-) Transcript_44889:81-1184(-)
MGNTQWSHTFAQCHKYLGDKHELTHEHAHEDTPAPGAPRKEEKEAMPQLGLRIVSDPLAEQNLGSGLRASFLTLGAEVMIAEVHKEKGWEALRWRFERSAKERAGTLYTNGPSATQTYSQPKMAWPEGYRFTAAKRYWKAKLISRDAQGSFQEHQVMLMVANAPEDRTLRNVEMDLEDSKDVCLYAERFNQHIRKSLGGEMEEFPSVKVCAPVGCEIIASSVDKFAAPGQHVMVVPFPFPEVKKFIFDGSEDFLEIPQSFFHHTAWMSSGSEFACDLQGYEEDDGGVILVDPCLLRADRPTMGTAMGTLFGSTAHAKQLNHCPQVEGPSLERFDMLHPRCSQMCKVFDPYRRSAQRRHCGLTVGCGV